jgi:hypothetical protein
VTRVAEVIKYEASIAFVRVAEVDHLPELALFQSGAPRELLRMYPQLFRVMFVKHHNAASTPGR